jgi:hypothetical protein
VVNARTEIATGAASTHFQFPRWANYMLPALINGAILVLIYFPILIALGVSPWTTSVGYSPAQPIPFSHRMHALDLKMDCRYCHSTVESDAFAAVPSAQVCMNCHASIKPDSPMLQPLRDSYGAGKPIHWTKVHDLPDFAYFNHAAHVNKGVGCVSCHGSVASMDIVRQTQPLSMAWCLGCHRQPEAHLRPLDQVTNPQWSAPDHAGKSQAELGAELVKKYGIRHSDVLTSCSTCHR